MDEILGSVDCASNRWQILVRKNWIVEFNSLCGNNAISTNLTLNYAGVEDFRNLSKMFAEAADHFEKEEKETEEKIKYLEDRWGSFKNAAGQLMNNKINETPSLEILKQGKETNG